MMHVGVRFGLLPETGSVVRASHERLLSPTSADYTRGQATFASMRLHGRKSQAFRDSPVAPAALPFAPNRRVGNCYEYRSLTRFAQELECHKTR
jgi:hypothetical protein